MPNWCDNHLRITHSDPAALEKFRDAWESGNLFQTLIPCPKELMETRSVGFGLSKDGTKSYEQRLQEFRETLNIELFGYPTWYEYCVNEWGTKWDIGYRDDRNSHAVIEQDGSGNDFIEVSFDSAWSPPTGAYEKLVDLGYEISAYYYEPGMAFCGRFDEDGDFCLKIEGNVDWAKKNIPMDIEDRFHIVETMTEYEESEE